VKIFITGALLLICVNGCDHKSSMDYRIEVLEMEQKKLQFEIKYRELMIDARDRGHGVIDEDDLFQWNNKEEVSE